MIGRYHVGQLFISGVEKLDPTVAVVLDRPRLGKKYKNSPLPGSLSARSDIPRKNRPKITKYRPNLSMLGRLVSSLPERQDNSGCMLFL